MVFSYPKDEDEKQTAGNRTTEGDPAGNKRPRVNTNGDSAFASDNDDDQTLSSSWADLDTTSSSASAEDEMVSNTVHSEIVQLNDRIRHFER